MLILFGFYIQILPWNTIKSRRLQNMQNRAQKVLFDWNFCSKTLLVCFLSVLETFRSRDRDVKSWDKKQYTLMARICSFPAVCDTKKFLFFHAGFVWMIKLVKKKCFVLSTRFPLSKTALFLPKLHSVLKKKDWRQKLFLCFV